MNGDMEPMDNRTSGSHGNLADDVCWHLAEVIRKADVDTKRDGIEPQHWPSEVEIIARALSDAGLRDAVELAERGATWEMESNDKIYLIQQIGGYRECCQKILTALRGQDSSP